MDKMVITAVKPTKLTKAIHMFLLERASQKLTIYF